MSPKYERQSSINNNVNIELTVRSGCLARWAELSFGTYLASSQSVRRPCQVTSLPPSGVFLIPGETRRFPVLMSRWRRPNSSYAMECAIKRFALH